MPIKLELTPSPAQPAVVTSPMAVPVPFGNASPTRPSNVGYAADIERPAQNTDAVTTASPLPACNNQKVVTVIKVAQPSTTLPAGT